MDSKVLSEQSIEEAIIKMRGMIDGKGLKAKPTTLLVYPPHLKNALRILGLIMHPVRRVQGLRKRKKALYWRDKK